MAYLLKSEKESLKQQNENIHKEAVNLNEASMENMRKLHEAERENTKLKLNFEQVQHDCKKQLANIKLERVKEKGEENRVKETLNTQIDGELK